MHSITAESPQSNLNLEPSQGEMPNGSCKMITVARIEWVETRWAANYWQFQFSRAKVREESLKADNAALRKENRGVSKLKKKLTGQEQENERLRTELSDVREQLREKQIECDDLQSRIASLNKMVFGKKSERTKKPAAAGASASDCAGRQRRRPPSGKVSRKRHDYSHLPLKDEQLKVAASQGRCSCCGKRYVCNGQEESEVVEIQVQGYRRRIRRQRQRSVCDCNGVQEVVASPVERLFPHTRYGLTVWVNYLFHRYMLHHTVGSFCRWSEAAGVALNCSTLVNRNPSFLELFAPLYHAIVEHMSTALVVHADETSWPVQIAGIKNGEHYRGWLWTVLSKDAMIVHIDRRRNREAGRVLLGSLVDLHRGESRLLVVCDRYAVYQNLSAVLDLELAYCWAHVRRDFLHAAAGREGLDSWCQKWVERIGEIYRVNRRRMGCYKPGMLQSEEFQREQSRLEALVEKFFQHVEDELKSASASARGKPLQSLKRHRDGLSVFVRRPEVAMDNNYAERMIRSAVIVRKISMGSKSEQAAQLMSCMMSVFQTLLLNGVKVREWLTEYLGACAGNGGRAPTELSEWLPWQMNATRLRRLQGMAEEKPQGP